MSYIDGFLIPVTAANKEAYRHARRGMLKSATPDA